MQNTAEFVEISCFRKKSRSNSTNLTSFLWGKVRASKFTVFYSKKCDISLWQIYSLIQFIYIQKLWLIQFRLTFEELLTANEEYSVHNHEIYMKNYTFLRKYLLLCQWSFQRCDKFGEKSSSWYEKNVFSKKSENRFYTMFLFLPTHSWRKSMV